MRELVEILACFRVDMLDQLAFVARNERIALHEPFGQTDDAELEAAAQLDIGTDAARDLDAASADIDNHGRFRRAADPIIGRQMDEPGFLGPRDDTRADSRLLRDGVKELAAVFGFAHRARRDGDDLVDAVRFGQTPELRQDLERGVHRLGRERAPVETACAQADHLLLAVDDLERQIRPHVHDDHVQRVGPDIDGGYSHDPWLTPISAIIPVPRFILLSCPVPTERYDLLHTRLERFTQALQGVEEGDVRAIHRTRVASRRLREVLPVLQLDADVLHKLSRRLRKITDRLGTVRELDVLLGVLDELGKAGRHPQSALARVAAAVDEERGRKRERLLAKGQLRELRRVGAKLEKLARTLEIRTPSPASRHRTAIVEVGHRRTRRAPCGHARRGHLRGRHGISARTAARRADCRQETAVCAGALGRGRAA